MAHSIIAFRGRSAMLSDADAVLVAHAVLDACASRAAGGGTPAPGVIGLLQAWRGLMDVYGPGCIDLRLDEFIRTEADVAALAAVLASTQQHLRDQGTTLRADYLNRIVNAPAVLHFEDRETQGALRALQRIEEVLGHGATA